MPSYISIIGRGGLLPATLTKDHIVVFNACGGEDLLEEYLLDPKGSHAIVNTKNAWSLPEAINQAMRAAPADSNVQLDMVGMAPLGSFSETSLFLQTDQLGVGYRVIDTIGMFDNAFHDQMWLLDYAFRAKLAGFNVFISDDIIKQELSPDRNGLTVLAFGTKWSIDGEVPPDKFWEFLNNSKYEWSDEMYVK